MTKSPTLNRFVIEFSYATGRINRAQYRSLIRRYRAINFKKLIGSPTVSASLYNEI